MNNIKRDHGGNLDQAIAQFGGNHRDWIDLSTGINPEPYPLPDLPEVLWQALPDQSLSKDLIAAARDFWNVPEAAAILPVPGASAAIARLPALLSGAQVQIPAPTYNEHAAAFAQHGWQVTTDDPAPVQVVVHPNNPTGRLWDAHELNAGLTLIDESFCDVTPAQSMIAQAGQDNRIILKSFGKFWGLAGLRLGFVIASPQRIEALANLIGPWAVSGPALVTGAAALRDQRWAEATRARLSADSARLDQMMRGAGATVLGGTSLFRLYEVADAAQWQDRLAQHHIWSRIFPYNPRWIRLGLPAAGRWDQLAGAL